MVLKVLPIVISSIALVVSIVGILTARKSYQVSRKEFLASRTLLLTSSIRPNLSASWIDKMRSADTDTRDQARQEFVRAFEEALIIFKPSLKPNTLLGVEFTFPKVVTPHRKMEYSNISAGQTTAFYIEQGIIKEGDFAAHAFTLTGKISDWLRLITPARYKVGTLNRAALPVAVRVDLIAKGDRYKEHQLYEMDVSYQVTDLDVLVQQINLNFLARIPSTEDVDGVLAKMMESGQFGVRFLSEPLPNIEAGPRQVNTQESQKVPAETSLEEHDSE